MQARYATPHESADSIPCGSFIDGSSAINILPACSLALTVAMVLTGCGSSGHDHAVAAPPPTSNAPAVTVAKVASATEQPTAAKVRSGGFDVRVALSPAAKNTLATRGETIVVSASYYGWPADSAKTKVDEVGQVDLGHEQHVLAAPGVAHFAGARIAAGTQRALKQPPQVNINVFSGRKTSPDNMLDCDIFQGAIAIASKSPVAITCKLLTEK